MHFITASSLGKDNKRSVEQHLADAGDVSKRLQWATDRTGARGGEAIMFTGAAIRTAHMQIYAVTGALYCWRKHGWLSAHVRRMGREGGRFVGGA